MKPYEVPESTSRPMSFSSPSLLTRSDQKSKTLRDLSHEFRSPLASIIGFAETILDDPEMPDGDFRLFTEIIRQEALRLRDTMEKVLELSQRAVYTEREEFTQPDTEQLYTGE